VAAALVAMLFLAVAGCGAISSLTGRPKMASKADVGQLLTSLDEELASVLETLDQLDDVEDEDLTP